MEDDVFTSQLLFLGFEQRGKEEAQSWSWPRGEEKNPHIVVNVNCLSVFDEILTDNHQTYDNLKREHRVLAHRQDTLAHLHKTIKNFEGEI